MSSHLGRQDLGCRWSCRLEQRWPMCCSGRNVGLWDFRVSWCVWLWVWIPDSDRGVGAFLYDPLWQSISEHRIISIWLCFYCQVKELELTTLVKASSGLDLCRQRNQNWLNTTGLFICLMLEPNPRPSIIFQSVSVKNGEILWFPKLRCYLPACSLRLKFKKNTKKPRNLYWMSLSQLHHVSKESNFYS